MFGLGGGEILLIVLIAIIFIGPKDIPKVAHRLGKLYRQFKTSADEIQNTVKKEIQDLNEEDPTKKH